MRFTLIVGLCAGAMVLAASVSAQAQTSSSTQTGALKDGVFRRGSMMMRLKDGQAARLTAPLTLENGTVVRPDGLIIGTDGVRQVLPAGRAINLQGQIVGLTDDMLSAVAIEQHDQRVTGATATRIDVPGVAPASGRTTALLVRTEQRLSMLQQLSDLLAQRTAALGAGNSSEQLDAQIQRLDVQLR